MINIVTDTPIQFDKVDPFFDLLHRDSNEEILFREIKKYLITQNVHAGYSLGKVGGHEEVGLIYQDGYWIVTRSEKGSTHFLGVFRSYYDATNFFVWALTKKAGADMIDWKAVFE